LGQTKFLKMDTKQYKTPKNIWLTLLLLILVSFLIIRSEDGNNWISEDKIGRRGITFSW